MPLLSRSEILRIKAEIREATTRSHELLRETGRLLHEYGQTVKRSRELLEKSRELIARAKPNRWSLSPSHLSGRYRSTRHLSWFVKIHDCFIQSPSTVESWTARLRPCLSNRGIL